MTPEGRLRAAVFAAAPMAAASHESAGYLWGLLPPSPVPEPTIAVARAQAPTLRGVRVHRSRDLAERWLSTRRGIRTVNPLLTMVDLGAVVPASVLEDCLDRGLTANLFNIAALEYVLDEVARPGRRGCGVLKRVLDNRALGDKRADGLLEPRMARLLRRAGLPLPVFQHNVYDAVGRWLGRVDFAYPERMIALEVDGWEKRATPRAMEHDLTRQNLITAAGWIVLRFTWNHVVRRPGYVASTVATQLAR